MPLPELAGTLGLKRAAHLLRRATFGATKAQIDSYATLTPAQAINALFHQTLPDAPVPIDPKTGTEWVESGPTDANSDDLDELFKRWFIGQMLSAGVSPTLSLAYSARERLVFFLHSHFTTISSTVGNSRSLYFQNALFRLFAMDGLSADPDVNIKTLTVKISIDNAMLRLLNGNENVKGSVNENYGRELLELYTIGRGLEGTLPPSPGPGDYIMYTEQDVRAAARVLSGWDVHDDFEGIANATIDIDTTLPRGKVRGSATNASAHDNDPKQFSARFGNTVIQGSAALMAGGNPTEASALDEIVQLVDLIYSKPETARNICWKIYRFFVYAPHTTEECVALDSTIVAEMANTLIASNYKILPVIENLLRSVHFYEATAGTVTDDNFGGIIKNPLDLVVQSLRFFEVPITDMTTSATGFYEQIGEVIESVRSQAMNFYEPYDVAGYDAFHQFPVYHRYWITPNTLANRYEFVRNLITSSEPGMLKANVYDFVRNNIPNATAADARQLVMMVADYILPVTDNLTYDDAADDLSGLTSRRLNYFKERFLQTFDEAYWTTRWNEGAGDLRDQLEYLFNAMMQSPEYQLA